MNIVYSHHKVRVNLQASNMDALKKTKLGPSTQSGFVKFKRTFSKLCTLRCLNCCLYAIKITAVTVV